MTDHEDPGRSNDQVNDRVGDAGGGTAESTEAVPPGREGADSGASDAVHVDSEGVAELPDRSHGNDIPGVGPREAEGGDEDPSYEEEIDSYRSSRPDRLSDETGGAPHLNRRNEPAPHEEEPATPDE